MLTQTRETGRIENEITLVQKDIDHLKRSVTSHNSRFNQMLDSQEKSVQENNDRHSDFLAHLATLKTQYQEQISDRTSIVNTLRDTQMTLRSKQVAMLADL